LFALYAVTEDILRQTGGFSCHENQTFNDKGNLICAL